MASRGVLPGNAALLLGAVSVLGLWPMLGAPVLAQPCVVDNGAATAAR